jgi:predicted RNA-binding Zn-ribbon protein involved in translation (DUF1610 family)
MICPHCGAEHAEEKGRFCESCGLAVTDLPEGSGVCPSCGAPHSPEQGRFCDACGMSVYTYAKAAKTSEGEEGQVEERFLVRCRHCGTKAKPPTCPACGNKMPIPDDWVEE